MTRKNWYRACLLLPLALPALLLGVTRYVHVSDTAHPNVLLFSSAAFFELLFGGAQYALFVMLLFFWSRNTTARQMARASWALPFWFWPLCTLGIILGMHGDYHLALMTGLYAIPFGYAYVILTHLLTWMLQKCSMLKD